MWKQHRKQQRLKKKMTDRRSIDSEHYLNLKMELEDYLVNKNVLGGIQANKIQSKDQMGEGEKTGDGKGSKSKQTDFFSPILCIEISKKIVFLGN